MTLISTKSKILSIILLVLVLAVFTSYIYFYKYLLIYDYKLEKCSRKVGQINEKIIEIIVSFQITNPTT